MPAKKSNSKKKVVRQRRTPVPAKKAEAYLMDTNVILVANRDQSAVTEECIRICLSWINDLKNGDYKLVLDESGLILEEYENKRVRDNSNSIHSQFLIWLYNNIGYTILVPITQGKNINEFEEFPKDSALKGFERADRKFVATAISYERNHNNKKRSPILEACDTDYKFFQDALEKYIDIEFICPDDIEKLFTRKKSK